MLLVDGGDATSMCRWTRESGPAELPLSLPDTVWVGAGAGSMVMTPRIGTYFVERPSAPGDRTLGSSTAPSRWSPRGNGRSSAHSRPAFVSWPLVDSRHDCGREQVRPHLSLTPLSKHLPVTKLPVDIKPEAAQAR